LENVQFGGGSVWDLGQAYDISAPSAIYNFNEYVALGGIAIQIPKTTFLRLICMEEANCTFESHK
jgi:hypothetical protein